MSFTYPDQNALIRVGFKALKEELFCRKLMDSVRSGSLTTVVSPWHLVETAHARKIESAIRLAEFIDSLRPAWLLERRDIQRIEVHEDCFAFAKVEYESPARVTTRSQVFATLNGAKDALNFDIPSRRFVEQWMRHPEQLKPLEKPFKDNIDALMGLRKAVKAGKLTEDIKRRTDRILIAGLMPSVTPAGLELGRELTTKYLDQARVDRIPTLAIEFAVAEHERQAQGGVDRNTLIDKFHLTSALPYLEEIVSDDKFFHAIYPVAQRTGHVKAKLLNVDEFLKRF